jgi:hypothetical protein
MLNENADPKQLNQLWKMLDDMASSDPQGYRKYIENVKNQAKFATRIIQPGFYVRSIANDGSYHVLNLCKSKAVEAPTDSFNIPTLMSDQRPLTEKGHCSE